MCIRDSHVYAAIGKQNRSGCEVVELLIDRDKINEAKEQLGEDVYKRQAMYFMAHYGGGKCWL